MFFFRNKKIKEGKWVVPERRDSINPAINEEYNKAVSEKKQSMKGKNWKWKQLNMDNIGQNTQKCKSIGAKKQKKTGKKTPLHASVTK